MSYLRPQSPSHATMVFLTFFSAHLRLDRTSDGQYVDPKICLRRLHLTRHCVLQHNVMFRVGRRLPLSLNYVVHSLLGLQLNVQISTSRRPEWRIAGTGRLLWEDFLYPRLKSDCCPCRHKKQPSPGPEDVLGPDGDIRCGRHSALSEHQRGTLFRTSCLLIGGPWPVMGNTLVVVCGEANP